MAARPEDRYTNLASASATESSPGTLTFSELMTGISLGQGIGMLIDQIDYLVSPSAIELILGTPADSIAFGWFTSNVPTTVNLNDRRTIHAMQLTGGPVVGVAASAGAILAQPFVHQFFPPMIVAAPRLFLGILGASLANPADVTSRLYFRYVELTTKEYLELAEAFILVG